MAGVQRRSALRVVSAYRTVSEDAALVLAGTPPVNLLAVERKATHGGLKRSEARDATMIQWQQRWESATRGRWTQRLVGDLNYHLTQLLAGHGCFGTYLHKIRKEATPS
ncbi:uncharacterized protein LOC143922190 [Arctopsyche grandis]|uniref:uncharacterized protein LOC143922190 n=1 Tax=Arctopsyche grandis TaxID=121162 RepID=UPI00406D76D4